MLIAFFLITACSVHAHIPNALPWQPWHGQHGVSFKLLKSLLPENPIILESGSHRGEDTMQFIAEWPQATIYAFEPVPHYYETLKERTAPYTNIKVFAFGLFSLTGTYLFHLSTLTNGASSLFADNHIPNGVHYGDRPIYVQCQNLDEWAQEHKVNKIDFMWLDMEGAEYQVLSTAPNILSTVSVIFTEVNFREFRVGMGQFEELYDFLAAQGFTLLYLWGEPGWQANALFVRKRG